MLKLKKLNKMLNSKSKMAANKSNNFADQTGDIATKGMKAQPKCNQQLHKVPAKYGVAKQPDWT